MCKKIVRILIGTLLFSVILASSVLAAGIPFTDVDSQAPYYHDLNYAYYTGIVNGKSETVFAPDDYLTYSEAVKLAACMHIVYTGGQFPTENEDVWYQPYVDYCYTNGIITKEYPWDFPIKRGEYMDIFSRALPEDALRQINRVDDDMIPDVPMHHTYANGIYCLYRAGVINGVDSSYACRPDAYIKRSDIVPVLTRMMEQDYRYIFSLEDIPEKLLLVTTPIGDLYYPGKWSGCVSAKILTLSNGYAAEVYGETISGTAKLYTLYIGADTQNGFCVGYVNNNEIRIEVSDLSINHWADDDKNMMMKMQEDMAELINQITMMPGFNDTAVEENPPVEDFVLLTTPIGKLYYPGRWSGQVSATVLTVTKGYAAEIYGETASGTAKLYTVYIGTNEKSGFCAGYINGTEVRVNVSDLSVSHWMAADRETINGMQEDLNILLDQLASMPGFSETAVGEGSSAEDFVLLTTPIGNLYYPGKWRESVSVNILTISKGYAAEIYGETASGTAKLYTVYIGTNEKSGFCAGYINGTEVRVNVSDLSVSHWMAADRETINGMQEDLNILLDQLASMPGFSETAVGEGSSAEDFVLLTTPIGNLYYPGRWSNSVSATVLNVSEGYIAEIYGVTSSGRAKLYTIYIDSATPNGFCLGSVNGVEIWFDICDLSVDNWQESDRNAINGMQEDVNEIINQICSLNGFAYSG